MFRLANKAALLTKGTEVTKATIFFAADDASSIVGSDLVIARRACNH